MTEIIEKIIDGCLLLVGGRGEKLNETCKKQFNLVQNVKIYVQLISNSLRRAK